MTGFGLGRGVAGDEELVVELRSVNHKFCEVKVRLPKELFTLEPVVVKCVKERLSRGAVEVFVKRQSPAGVAELPAINPELAAEYLRALTQLAHKLGLPDTVTVQDIASQPGVLRLEERTINLDDARRALDGALRQALDGLLAMRRTEGEAIATDLRARVGLVGTAVERLQVLAPGAVVTYRQRLEERLAELARGLSVDPQRLAQEVAFFAERTDVAEEMSRLNSHVGQFLALLSSSEPAGRKMDFLIQEMHREVNTTGSKSQHPEISTVIVELKAELERIREQVQNVE